MKILVDRRIGGFGDLMMLSTPMRKLISSGHEVGLVIDRKWRGLFKHWRMPILDGISNGWDQVVDVHQPCPASIFEVNALKSSRIDKGMARGMVNATRIEAFSAALGIHLEEHEMTPVVVLSDEERQYAVEFVKNLPRPIVYVQADAAEQYKSWRFFPELCDALEARGCSVVTYGPCGDRMSLQCSLLHSIAIIDQCDLLVGVDSMGTHAAAAVDTPSVLIAGPMNPGARIATYPGASGIYLGMQCVPCWRNEGIPCHVSGTNTSTCMENLEMNPVMAHIERRLEELAAGTKKPREKYEEVLPQQRSS